MPAGACNRIAHLARRKIRDAAHRVDRLEGRAGAHQYPSAAKQLRYEKGDGLFDQLLGFEHPPVTGLAAGLFAGAGAQQRHAVGLQLRRIAPGGCGCPHLAVHGWRHQQRHITRQDQCGQQIVGQPVNHLGQEVSGGGRHQDRIGIA